MEEEVKPRKCKTKNYSDEEKEMILDLIFERIENGSSLFDALKKKGSEENMIPHSTFDAWIKLSDTYSAEYARVRSVRHDRLAEKTLIVAETPLTAIRTVESEKGTFTTTYDNVDRSRLIINASQWYLEKLGRSTYGKDTGETGAGHVEQELFPDLHNEEI